MDKKNDKSQKSNESGKGTGPRRAKEVISQSAERWLARNRSLVLRQTPIWAQSLATIVVSLGISGIAAGLLFRIDEVVTVTGQLESLGGSVEVKTPAGGKIASVLFKDGSIVRKGQPLVRFDTQQAAADQATNSKLIELERSQLDNKLKILKSRESVLKKKVQTSEQITSELGKLVRQGGFQKVQYLQQLDQLYELQSQLSNLRIDMNRTRLEAEKSIGRFTNQLQRAELQLQYKNVVAPISGVIFEPKATASGVIGAGDTIVTIIPQRGLKGKVFVQNKDIGFVKTGQKARVRIDAFPFTQYGELGALLYKLVLMFCLPTKRLTFTDIP